MNKPSAKYQLLLTRLAELGSPCRSLDALRTSGHRYSEAIPLLVQWLPLLDDPAEQEALVRTLSVPWARNSEVARALIREFAKASQRPLRWAIGNALEVTATAAEADVLLPLVRNPSFGTARQMVVRALGRVGGQSAVPVLLELLSDEETVGHAAWALGKLRATKATSQLNAMRDHPIGWVRRTVARSLRQIAKESEHRPSLGE